MSYRGIDVRQSGNRVLIRAFLLDGSNAIVTTGSAALRLFELRPDGALWSYDFASHTFKSTAVTTETAALAHQAGNNGTTNTGVWTYALTTVSGFTRGGIYLAAVDHSSAVPTRQVREFQYGEGAGDLSVDSQGHAHADARKYLGSAITGSYAADVQGAATQATAANSAAASAAGAAGAALSAAEAAQTQAGQVNARLPETPAATGDAMALTSGERTTLAELFELRLLNDGDGQALINAIVGSIGNTNLDQAAVVAAVRADLERVGGYLRLIDAKTTNLPAQPAAVGNVPTAAAIAAAVRDADNQTPAANSLGLALNAAAQAAAAAKTAAESADGKLTAPRLAKVDALTFTTAGRVDASIVDKSGMKLASDGLDAVSTADPTGSPAGWTFRQALTWLCRRFAGRGQLDANAGTLKVYGANGSTVITTQTISSAGGVQEQGPAA